MKLESAVSTRIFHHCDSGGIASSEGQKLRGIPSGFAMILNDNFFKNGNIKAMVIDDRIMRSLGVTWGITADEFRNISPF